MAHVPSITISTHRCTDHEVVVTIRGVYDGGLYSWCPVCDRRWHRWPEGDRRHTAAIPYVERHPVDIPSP